MKNCFKFDKTFLLLVVILTFSNIANQMIPLILPRIFIDALTESKPQSYVIAVAAIYGVSILIFGLISMYTDNYVNFGYIRNRFRFLSELGRKIMLMDYQNLENPDMLDLMNRAKNAGGGNWNGIEGMMRQSVLSAESFLMIFATSAIVLTLNPLVIISLAALFVIYTCIIRVKNNNFYKKLNDEQTTYWRRRWHFAYSCQNFACGKDVRLFTLGSLLSKKHRDTLMELFKYSKKSTARGFKSGILFAIGTLIQNAVIYAYLCYLALNDKVSIGEVLMYISAIEVLIGRLSSVIYSVAEISNCNKYVCDYRKFMEIKDQDDGTREINPEDFKGNITIKFDNVSFKYPKSDKYALRNFSCEIKPNEKIAVVGLNGAGKSTFIKLLIRLYRPSEGTIYLNGIDINEFKRRDYYNLFSTVFQEIMMFAFTVKENITMQKIEETDEARLERVVEQSGMKEKVSSLKYGLDTNMLKNIDEEGIDLSGGEKQKLALARSLYKDGNILILDEPTSALDALAEENIYRQFNDFAENKTAIYISHRLASTKFCDRVYLFEEGECKGTGTHDELLKTNSLYKKLFNAQAKYYQETGDDADEADKEAV